MTPTPPANDNASIRSDNLRAPDAAVRVDDAAAAIEALPVRERRPKLSLFNRERRDD